MNVNMVILFAFILGLCIGYIVSYIVLFRKILK